MKESKKKVLGYIGFALLILLNCAPIAVASAVYREDLFHIFLWFVITQTALVLVNALCAKNTFQYFLLSIHLLIASLIGQIIWVLLDYAYNNELSEIFAILFYAILISAFVAAALAGCGFGIYNLKILIIKRVTKRDLPSSSESPGEKRITVWGVVLLWVVFLAVVSIPHPVHIADPSHAVISYTVNYHDVKKDLTDEDAAELADLINRQSSVIYPDILLYYDERDSIEFDTQTFFIDKSGKSLRYNARYIYLSQEDAALLSSIISKR